MLEQVLYVVPSDITSGGRYRNVPPRIIFFEKRSHEDTFKAGEKS